MDASVLIANARSGRPVAPVLAALRDLEMSELPFPPDTAVRLTQLRVQTGLKMPDCCVLMTAEAAGATVASVDERLGEAAEERRLPVKRR